MGRLIDADALIKRLWEQHKGIQVNADMYTNADEVAEEVCNLVSFIDEQPTAYDIEKVVAELEESMNGAKNLWDDDEYYIGCANAFESAIEIVKRGGIRD